MAAHSRLNSSNTTNPVFLSNRNFETHYGVDTFLLEHDRTALVVPPRHPQALAEAALRLLEDVELSERLSANSRRSVTAYATANVLPLWTRLYRDLAGGTHKGPPSLHRAR